MHGRQLCCYHGAHGMANHMYLFPLEHVLHSSSSWVPKSATAMCKLVSTERVNISEIRAEADAKTMTFVKVTDDMIDNMHLLPPA